MPPLIDREKIPVIISSPFLGHVISSPFLGMLAEIHSYWDEGNENDIL